jgi:predicted phage terminase large subunit-like protein
MPLTAETINGFSGALLQSSYDEAVASPPCHLEWWELMCDKHPFVAIAAPRGHGKTTAVSGAYVLANVLFREKSYVLIVSDTVSQAIQFLGDLKNQLNNNERIRSLFKIKEFVKDAEDDVIVACEDGHFFRIQAKGSEQKVRGLKWNGKRPDLIVCDDLENDEIVMNKERREKFRNWFSKALLPCRSASGIVRYVGTILHTDSMLERLMPKQYDKKTIVEPLKIWTTKRETWKSVKYRAHSDDFKHILWPERWPREKLMLERQFNIDQGHPENYSQEYLNIPIDESFSYFRRNDFLPATKQDKDMKLNYYITVDLAISKEDHADYSVFLVSGIDENRRLHIVDVVRARLDGMEIVDTLLELEKAFKPEVIGIEEMQVSKAIGPFLREEMVRRNVFPNIVPLKHGGKDKIARARSIQGRLRAHTVRFDKEGDWYQEFEDEVCTFPRGKHDDQVDAFAYLGLLLDKVLEAPTLNEIEEEEYLNELQEYESDAGANGRNQYTGY